jgi:hypothetical protein
MLGWPPPRYQRAGLFTGVGRPCPTGCAPFEEDNLHAEALVVLGALAVVLAIVVPATASRARDITSRDFDDNTIRSEDIHQGAIEMGDLSDG